MGRCFARRREQEQIVDLGFFALAHRLPAQLMQEEREMLTQLAFVVEAAA